jgi:hypothetical protein
MDYKVAPGRKPTVARHVARFGIHLVAVYAIVKIITTWLAGFVHGWLLPVLQQHPPSVSGFQFAFTHLLAFSSFPAFLLAFLYAHWYRHNVACFVWIVPLAIIAYKIISFHSGASVLSANDDQFAAAFRHYFSGNFAISEFHSYRELFQMAASNPDMTRGIDQYRYTAPLYAAIGYSIGTLVGIKVPTPKLHSALEFMKPSMSSGK